MATGSPLLLAHRGDWRVAPENSLEALVAAARIPGCDGVEFDVRLSRDDVPVLLHDETLRRVQRHPGRVDGLDALALADLGVPTLAAVLGALPAAVFLDVELKGDAHREATAAVLRSDVATRRTRPSSPSFEPATLDAMRTLLPGWRRWLNAEDLAPATLSLAVGLGCGGVSVLWGGITSAGLRCAADAGLEVAAWTVRRSATVARLGRLGVVACCVEGGALGPLA